MLVIITIKLVFSDGKKLSFCHKGTKTPSYFIKFFLVPLCLGGNQFLTMFRSKLS